MNQGNNMKKSNNMGGRSGQLMMPPQQLSESLDHDTIEAFKAGITNFGQLDRSQYNQLLKQVCERLPKVLDENKKVEHLIQLLDQ